MLTLLFPAGDSRKKYISPNGPSCPEWETLKIAPVKSHAVYFFFVEVTIFVYFKLDRYLSLSRVYAYLKGNMDSEKVVLDCSPCGYSPEGLKLFFRATNSETPEKLVCTLLQFKSV